jgi:hypothetical protein
MVTTSVVTAVEGTRTMKNAVVPGQPVENLADLG